VIHGCALSTMLDCAELLLANAVALVNVIKLVTKLLTMALRLG
jgi:hypothetical protein